LSEFIKLVPPGWLKVYLETMQEAKNEMPMAFHFLTGAAIIGNMLGLRTWATIAKGVRVFPNINVLLLSPAGKCRRGEGTKLAMAVARRAGVCVFAGKITPEGLVDELIENPSLILYSEELSMLLTKQDHQKPLIPVLTKLLLHGDGTAEVRTRSMGKRRQMPSVNLTSVFTSAPDWFMTTIPEEAFAGGLMSRFLVCCLEDRDIYHIDITADDVTDKLVTDLSRELAPVRHVLKGHIKGTKLAQKWIEGFYKDNETKEIEDEKFEPHRNRKPSNLLRIAMILAAAAGTAELSRDRLEQGLQILEWLEPTMSKLYGMERVIGKFPKGERRIITVIKRAGCEISHTNLARSCSSYLIYNLLLRV